MLLSMVSACSKLRVVANNLSDMKQATDLQMQLSRASFEILALQTEMSVAVARAEDAERKVVILRNQLRQERSAWQVRTLSAQQDEAGAQYYLGDTADQPAASSCDTAVPSSEDMQPRQDARSIRRGAENLTDCIYSSAAGATVTWYEREDGALPNVCDDVRHFRTRVGKRPSCGWPTGPEATFNSRVDHVIISTRSLHSTTV